MMQHLAILVHKYHAFDKTRSFLRQIAQVWLKQGLRVTAVHGTERFVDADLAILHIDLTVVPADYLAFARQYPIVINGRVTDISKRRISQNLVRRGDGYEGPVIVKTNQNYGGMNEWQLVEKGSRLQKYLRSLRDKLPWTCQSKLSLSSYRIFESASQIPRMVWYNPDLVVERFLPERHDGYYCLRTWVFFGDKETGSLSYSKEPIIKSNNVIGREPVADVPEDLRLMRQNLGFDFGKFDYVIVDGRTILYDVSRTPSLGRFSTDQYLPKIQLLAEGIRNYLRRS